MFSVKWADTMTSESVDGKQRGFDHPFLQACGMFLGEMMCMLAFYLLRWHRRRKLRLAVPSGNEEGLDNAPPAAEDDPVLRERNFSPLIFLPPALCDMTATSVQYLALTLTYASSFQMLRGAVIIFTGLFSRVFLRRRFQWFKWLGIMLVIVGLAIVGVCDMIYVKPSGGGGKNETLLRGHGPVGANGQYFHHEFVGGSIRGVNHHNLGGGDHHSSSDILLGDTLIVCSQVRDQNTFGEQTYFTRILARCPR